MSASGCLPGSLPRPGHRSHGIVPRTGFFVLDWTLNFTRATVIIDGHLHELPWGQHFSPLEPGQAQLQVSYRYLRLSRAGKASILVDAAANQVVQVSYRAPRSVLVAFLPDKLTIVSRPTLPRSSPPCALRAQRSVA
jgi:hypothetical protein